MSSAIHAISGLGASFFRSVSGMSAETESVDRLTQAHQVVSDNKDDSGRYASECDATTWVSHTRPFADGLILYNGHAGLGGNAASRCEPIKTPGRIEYPNLTVAPVDAPATPQE
jgi:hypothetical protein